MEIFELPTVVLSSGNSFFVRIDKSNGGLLGLELDEATLEVLASEGDGLVASWNNANPHQVVLPGARILQVNGHQEAKSILNELVQDVMLEMTLIHPKEAHQKSALSGPDIPRETSTTQRSLTATSILDVGTSPRAHTWQAIMQRVQAEEIARKFAVAELTSLLHQAVTSIDARLETVRLLAEGTSAAGAVPSETRVPKFSVDTATPPRNVSSTSDSICATLADRCDELATAQLRAAKDNEAALRALTDHVAEVLEVQNAQVQRVSSSFGELDRECQERLGSMEQAQRHLEEAVAGLMKATHKRMVQIGTGIPAVQSELPHTGEDLPDDQEACDGIITRTTRSTHTMSPTDSTLPTTPSTSRPPPLALCSKAEQASASGGSCSSNLTSSIGRTSRGTRRQLPACGRGNLTISAAGAGFSTAADGKHPLIATPLNRPCDSSVLSAHTPPSTHDAIGVSGPRRTGPGSCQMMGMHNLVISPRSARSRSASPEGHSDSVVIAPPASMVMTPARSSAGEQRFSSVCTGKGGTFVNSQPRNGVPHGPMRAAPTWALLQAPAPARHRSASPPCLSGASPSRGSPQADFRQVIAEQGTRVASGLAKPACLRSPRPMSPVSHNAPFGAKGLPNYSAEQPGAFMDGDPAATRPAAGMAVAVPAHHSGEQRRLIVQNQQRAPE